MNIRKAMIPDLSRVAEIYVFNNRINYFPIFKDAGFSFGKLQVVSLVDQYLKRKKILENIYVFDDGLIKGFIQIKGTEICQLFVEPLDHVWALEKNIRAISFYQKHGFYMTGQKKFEEGTAECIVELEL